MKKIFIILFTLLSLKISAQTSIYKTPEQYPTEFSMLSNEYLEWYNENSGIVNYDYSKVDNQVLSIIKQNPNIQDIDLLVSLLTKSCSNDLEKSRSFYTWLIYSIKYSTSIRDSFPTSVRSSDSREDDAIFCFKKRRGACVEISSIFHLMCKKSNVRAFIVGGYYKELNAAKNGYIESGHAWNVFKYNNNYYFLDVTFGLQTKYKNDIFRNTHFIINSELYKYLYTPYDIYGSLSYKLNNTVYTQERDWILYLLQYQSSNRVDDEDWKEFNKVRVLVEKTYHINPSEWIKFPVFGYENFSLSIVKKWASKYEVKTEELGICPIDTFSLLKEKEYKKLKTNDRIAYNRAAEQYYPYWIKYYKVMAERYKNDAIQYELCVKEGKKIEYDFTYYKIFKR